MTTELATRTAPEEDELTRKRQELLVLESELLEQELRLATLRADVMSFERQYLRTVGIYYVELDEVNAEIADHVARRRPHDQQVRRAAEQAHAQAQESRQAVSGQDLDAALAPPSSAKMKSLYREVAKKIHPDLTYDPADRNTRSQLMAEANRAYTQGDEARLRQILEDYECSPEAVCGNGVAADLARVIRRITQVKKRLDDIKLEIESLISSDLHQLQEKTREAADEGRDLLTEIVTTVKNQINAARERLREIAGATELT